MIGTIFWSWERSHEQSINCLACLGVLQACLPKFSVGGLTVGPSKVGHLGGQQACPGLCWCCYFAKTFCQSQNFKNHNSCVSCILKHPLASLVGQAPQNCIGMAQAFAGLAAPAGTPYLQYRTSNRSIPLSSCAVRLHGNHTHTLSVCQPGTRTLQPVGWQRFCVCMTGSHPRPPTSREMTASLE